jgi:two-component system NtrC family sensor kinase
VVAKPVSQLLKGTREVARGELQHEIPVRAADEIGTLAASFNQMTASLRRAQGEIRDLMEGLERQVEDRTAALRSAQSQLVQSEKMASLGTLAASIAHEINNPLSGILTSAKLMLRTLAEGPADERAQRSFARQLTLVERETQRCTAIVRNLLDFARQREPTLKDVDINACLDEALSLLTNQIRIQGVVLDRRLAPVPYVRADFGQLRQVFVNIVLNACEAMRGGGTLTVQTRVAPDGGVEVEVRDTGAGIPREHLSKIFDPFFTTKEKGTGLGLSVVYGVVQRHGGTARIDSEVGKGTAVVIRLPRAGEAEPAGVVAG